MRLIFFFFFQAEDGIRDFHVTGVQTCALPIYGGGGEPARLEDGAGGRRCPLRGLGVRATLHPIGGTGSPRVARTPDPELSLVLVSMSIRQPRSQLVPLPRAQAGSGSGANRP